MLTVIVSLRIRPERTDEFLAAIEENARASLRDEPGCLRFDVHRDQDDPERFLLHEIYADDDAFFVAHRAAPHYARWLEAVEATVAAKSNAYYRPVA